ncbi:MAG TPA: tryptophan synthase subunit alpha [Dehalococcoidia bacterium]|nr:tryptophan synthase subunit alpha [Dehalococcoidia bacterium]
MSSIKDIFNKKGHKALIAYLTVGYPSVEATLEMVPLIASSGCDLVELGIPFSDPLADGTTIQRASYHALQQGTTPELCLEVAQKLSAEVGIPLVFMTYFNPVHRYGLDAFCRDCALAGISGLIVPDLPPEEGAELEEISRSHGIDLIYLLAPTSTDERIALVAERSRGFIYLVSLTGVTGARDTLPQELESFVSTVRKRARQPLCVGFGISTADLARRAAKVADGVIVGSRLIQLLEEKDPAPKVRSFIESLRSALQIQSMISGTER